MASLTTLTSWRLGSSWESLALTSSINYLVLYSSNESLYGTHFLAFLRWIGISPVQSNQFDAKSCQAVASTTPLITFA